MEIKTCETCRHAQDCVDRDVYSVCQTVCEEWQSEADRYVNDISWLLGALIGRYQATHDPTYKRVAAGVALALHVLSGQDAVTVLADMEHDMQGRYQTFDSD